jgi:hypothetical protein
MTFLRRGNDSIHHQNSFNIGEELRKRTYMKLEGENRRKGRG